MENSETLQTESQPKQQPEPPEPGIEQEGELQEVSVADPLFIDEAEKIDESAQWYDVRCVECKKLIAKVAAQPLQKFTESVKICLWGFCRRCKTDVFKLYVI